MAVRLGSRRGLICLSGQWAGGSTVLTCEPLAVVRGAAAMDAVDDLPQVHYAHDDAVGGTDRDSVRGGAADAVGGGWFGLLDYDGSHVMGFYDWVLRSVDGQWWFESLHSSERADELHAVRTAMAGLLRAAEAEPGAAPGSGCAVGAFTGPSPDRHLGAVERAIGHIRAGDIYQVNVCTRLAAPFGGSAVELFARAVPALRPAYASYLDLGQRQLVGLSPELFLRRRGREVLTAPIKGTRPRIGTSNAGADELRRSTKDVAENVMITDLMRNDLGRVCDTGSVTVQSLLGVEPHPGLWHLVSRVRGRLRAGVGDAALLRATFPPGSVTGAPKVRAAEVIAAVEERSRGAYTGAVGFVSPCWGAEFDVAIRTFEVAGDRVELGVGGGITADSVPVLEWQECLDKAAPLVAAAGAPPLDLSPPFSPPPRPSAAARMPDRRAAGVFETVLVVDGRALRLGDHLARLDRSRRELYGLGVPESTAAEARAAAAAAPGRYALRVMADAVSVTVTTAPAPRRPGTCAARSTTRTSGFWRHKWVDRAELLAAERAAGDAVPLFVAADGAVLETSRGNVFVLCRDGRLLTSPLRDEVLPGVTRRAVLDLMHDSGQVVEVRPFGVEDMVSGTPFWTSSLSLAVPITTVDGVAAVRDDGAVAGIAAALLDPNPVAPELFVR